MDNTLHKLSQSPNYIPFVKLLVVLGVIVTVAGGVMKIMSMPGNMLFICGMVALAMTFYLMAFLPYRPIEKDEAANDHLRPIWTFSIKIFGSGLSVLLLGILFWVEHWPGGNVLTICGSIATFGGVISLLVYRRQRSKF
ncbi:MAG: hypothetical protein J5792_03510 [Bacteroidales bacterium]|nr:hypothetical protein [Bacteroidales bacterium]